MSIARTLAEHALLTSGDSLPDTTRRAAVKMLLDTCACAYCGRVAPGIPELIGLERELGASGPASVFFSDGRLALPSAAYCNAAMIHALDYDNNYSGADIHILSIVVPIALACCEAVGGGGRRALTAMVLGVEIAARIAKPYMRAKRPHAYFLTTSLVGGWGGVATTGRLLGLSVDQMVNAMGIYYAHACGNRQALLERTLTKRIQPAVAAKAALYSALLAQRGFTGPEQTFEGKGGFYRCYTQDPPPPESLFADPASHAIEELAAKRFPTCGIHHAVIASALQMRREHGFAVHDIVSVDFFLNEGGGTLVSMPFEPGSCPQIDAQFCAPYAIALALAEGAVSVHDFTPGRIQQNQVVADLARRVRECVRFADLGFCTIPRPEPDHKYIKIVLRDGRVLEHGQASRPLNDPASMSLSDIREKFRDCATLDGEIDDAQVNELADAILAVEQAEDMRAWIAATLQPPSQKRKDFRHA